MNNYYDKDSIKAQLEIEQVFDLLTTFGADPEYNSTGIVAATICHNSPGQGSRKLYYYESNHLFYCFTHCDSFDIFELVIKIMDIQKGLEWGLPQAVNYIIEYFGINRQRKIEIEPQTAAWEVFKRHEYDNNVSTSVIELPEYNDRVLRYLPRIHIAPWEDEGISYEVCMANNISYYPPSNQIVIPHYDINNRLIGIRGRYLADEDAMNWGKYRPMIMRQKQYSHPLSMNLYGIDKCAQAIKERKVAIVAEGEKSVLQYQSYYGIENSIMVACCGSNFSLQQFNILAALGVREIVIAFDRQFEEKGNDEFNRLITKLTNIYNKYNKIINISLIFDKDMITPYKSSPTDLGKEVFEQLLNSRIKQL